MILHRGSSWSLKPSPSLSIAIARLKAEPAPESCPPPGERQLDPDARAQLIDYLERNVRSSDDDALLGRAARLGMVTSGD
jgi:hypothetical protein